MSHFSVAVITKTGSEKEIEKLLAPYQENNMEDCPKEYLKFFEDEDCEIDDETGKKGYWENPNAKWDWYVVGGRWSNLIKKKDGNKTDIEKISNIDLTMDKKTYKEFARYWEVVVDGGKLLDNEKEDDFFSFYKKEYYTEQYKTKENYATQQASFSTFAVVTPEGEWIEKGKMGWWGVNDATEESRNSYNKQFSQLLEEHGDYFLTIVDCHI